jgi:VWFA-related protein
MLTGKIVLRTFLALLICGYVAPAQLLNKGNEPPRTSTSAPTSPADTTPTFRSTSRLVVVDVVVADHDGSPTTGLKKEDFTVMEDGKLQALQVFEPHVPTKDLPLVPDLHLAPNEYTNFPKQAENSAVNIVLFDVLNTPADDQMFARQQMIEFLKTLPPGQRVALFTLGYDLRMVAGFTTSTDELIAAAKKLRPSVSALLDTEKDIEWDEHFTEGGPPGGGLAQRMGEFMQETHVVRLDMRVDKTFESLGALARSLSGYTGRKNLLWLSEAFPETVLPNADDSRSNYRNYLAVFQRYSGLMEASQISVYPIDIRGLKNTSLPSSDGAPGFHSPARENAYVGASQLTMRDVAEQTGGEAFYNGNDLKGAMQRSIEHGGTYYTLAYVPQNQNWNGAFRHIDVRVANRDLKPYFRKGYYGVRDDSSPADTARRMLIAEMQPGVPESTMLLMRVKLGAANDGSGKVSIDYGVPADKITFSGDPLKHAKLEFVVVAWNKDNKAAGDASATMEFDLKPETFQRVMNTGVPAHQELTLKPGTYKLRLGVMDYASSKIGTLEVPIIVGNPQTASK